MFWKYSKKPPRTNIQSGFQLVREMGLEPAQKIAKPVAALAHFYFHYNFHYNYFSWRPG